MQDTQELVFVVATATEETPDMLIDIRPNPHDLTPLLGLPASMHPALVYLAALSSNNSKRTLRGDLDNAARWLTAGACDAESCPWSMLRFQHTNALRAWLAAQYAPATANRVLAAVRGALGAAWQLGHMDTDSYMHACAVKAVKGGPTEPAGRALTAGEIARLLSACAADPSPAGVRDAAVLGLGLYAGLRREEIAGLDLHAYDPELRVLTVIGKGRKTRKVPVATGLDDVLADWLRLRGTVAGPLLLQVNKGGRIVAAGISGSAVYRTLAKRATEAGVKRTTPHDLRRSFATATLDAGADLAVTGDLLGHARTDTTKRYDRRGERARRAAVDRLHMAWTRRTP